MRKSLLVSSMLAIIVSLSILAYTAISPVYAVSYYAGVSKTNVYGARAWIYTPSSAPTIDNDGTFHFVSTAVCCNWVQAGWGHTDGDPDDAIPYVEHKIGTNHGIDEYGTQDWDTGLLYQVSDGFTSTWHAYISGSNKGGWGPLNNLQHVQGFSESRDSDQNEFDYTLFSSVQYRVSSGGSSWDNFDEDLVEEQVDYEVNMINEYYRYETFGP